MVRIFNVTLALALSAAITFALFFLMQMLIATGAQQPEKGQSIKIGDITIPEPDLEVQTVEPKPDEPEDPEEIPDLPELEFNVEGPSDSGISLGEVDVGDVGLNDDVGFSVSDTEMLPIVTMQPQYPNRALSRGIEGWCLVSFTVTETGSVIDPVVLDAEPPNIFDNASKRAVMRFKFNPRIEDGVAVQAHDVRYVFKFNLADD